MENQTQIPKEEKMETKKRGKGKSKYVNPVLAWGLIFVSLAIAIASAMVVILPLL